MASLRSIQPAKLSSQIRIQPSPADLAIAAFHKDSNSTLDISRGRNTGSAAIFDNGGTGANPNPVDP